jgi:carboxypeptidase D
VHWKGLSNEPAVKARAEPPIIEDRSTDNFRFLTSDTKREFATLLVFYHINYFPAYQVASLPDVSFDIGEMYAGLVPIDLNNKSRALYFVFQPTIGTPVDEITIWLNGGPGQWCCSHSLSLADVSQDAARLRAFSKRMADFFGRADNLLQRSILILG